MILETLYCRDICPAEQAVPQSQEYRQLTRKISEMLSELETKLTKEEMELVNEFHTLVIKANCIELETQFQYSFALGMLLMKDVYELPFPEKRL